MRRVNCRWEIGRWLPWWVCRRWIFLENPQQEGGRRHKWWQEEYKETIGPVHVWWATVCPSVLLKNQSKNPSPPPSTYKTTPPPRDRSIRSSKNNAPWHAEGYHNRGAYPASTSHQRWPQRLHSWEGILVWPMWWRDHPPTNKLRWGA